MSKAVHAGAGGGAGGGKAAAGAVRVAAGSRPTPSPPRSTGVVHAPPSPPDGGGTGGIQEVVADHLVRMADEYEMEAERLESFLDFVGLREERLSEAGRSSLAVLSGMASALNVEVPTPTSLAVTVSKLSVDIHRLTMECMAKEDEIAELRQRLHDTREARQRAETTRATLEAEAELHEHGDQSSTKLKAALSAASEKVSHYRKSVQQWQTVQTRAVDALASSRSAGHPTGLTVEDVSHSKLLEHMEDIRNVEASLDRVRVRLSEFHELPPDVDAAKARYTAAQEELKEAQRSFEAFVTESSSGVAF